MLVMVIQVSLTMRSTLLFSFERLSPQGESRADFLFFISKEDEWLAMIRPREFLWVLA